ncbi:peptidoglycan recognition protein family protein [candidate division KSB1 bacterium]|nr:peptidoglycan recognition protein family protein [candidate division KSB1 bacterium]
MALLYGFRDASSQPDKIKHLDRKIATVSQWGGTPAKDTSRVQEIKFITLHHGGEEFKQDKDFATYLINLQSWSRSEKKWIDIPYHYLIDFEGKIYEGRDIHYPGDTNTAYDPTGHALVCLPGNYEIQQPNDKQLRAVIDVFVWLCWKYELLPEVIKGHKDVAEGTVCPGKNLYAYFENGFIKKEVARQLKELLKIKD